MYRSASRYESRSIPEKPSRSARSTWESQQNRPYGVALEGDDRGLLRDPYLTEEAHVSDRDFQHNKGTNIGADLREAQRLAASFFSQYPAASTAPPPVYRDAARSNRPLSPEVPMERYSARGQYRDRDVGVERWPDRSNPEALYPPSRPQLVLEDWDEERIPVDSRRERMDLYGASAARGRKRDDGGWDDGDFDYGVVRKEADYPPIQATADIEGGLRVTKRVDWTGLLLPDGGRLEDGIGLDSTLTKRATSQNYRGGGRPYVDSYRNGLEDELDPEGSLYSRRAGGYYGSERYCDPEVRKERGYLDERLPGREDFVLDRSLGSRGSGRRGARGRDDWRTDRETSAGRGHRLSDSERGRDKGRYEERDSRRPFYSASRYTGGGSGSGADRDRDFTDDNAPFGKGRGGRYRPVKRDFSQRASITNQDILAVYYGNQGPTNHSSKFTPRRSFSNSGPSRYYDDLAPPRSERYRSRRSSRSPFRGRSGRYNPDLDPARKGKKRWEKSQAEGSEVKRFKRETQSDKLYLMHNSKATTEEKEDEAAASLTEREAEKTEANEDETKREASEPAPAEDAQESEDIAVEENDPIEPTNGSSDNEDLWSDSEEEQKHEQLTWDAPATDEGSTWGEATGEERDQATIQALQSGAVNDSKKFLGECSEDDEDDDADWESLASDLDDQLDDVCVHQGLEETDAVTESPDSKGVVPTNSEAQASEEIGKVGTLSVAQNQDSEMIDVDKVERSEEGKEVPDVETTVKEGVLGGENKVEVVMEELQESLETREDKAFDYYVSLFEQDTDLMKLYEANVNCGSFECLVCAGIGAKKKKRFPDVASLVQHAKKILRTKKLPEHRGFARALCSILGWETFPGPSVIFPQGCIPLQQSEPTVVLTGGASEEQKRDEGNAGGMDWEWAAARQLFEEQEARIDVMTRLSVKSTETESVTTPGCLLPSGEENSTSAQVGRDLVTVVETNIRGEKPTKVYPVLRAGEAPAEAFSTQEKSTLVDASDLQKVAMVEIVSVIEKARVEDICEKRASVMKAMSVPSEVKATTVGETLSDTVGEITRLAPKGDKDLLPSSSELLVEAPEAPEGITIDMWSALPLVEIAGDDSSQSTAVKAVDKVKNGVPLAVNEIRESLVVSVGDSLGKVGRILTGDAVSEDLGTTLVSVKATLGNGADGPIGELHREGRVENGDAVLPHATGNEVGASQSLLKWKSSTLDVVADIPPSMVDLGLSAGGMSCRGSSDKQGLQKPEIEAGSLLPT